jgi:ABC-type transport system involved in cytochrome c biogenesis ATPase subunit
MFAQLLGAHLEAGGVAVISTHQHVAVADSQLQRLELT